MKVKRIKRKKIIKSIGIAALWFAAGFCFKSALTPDFSAMMGPKGDPFVSVQSLEKKDVSVKKKFIAEVEAINRVDIVPQVSGYLEQVLFEDGANVKEGDVLFVIEQSKFISALQAAEADLEKAKSDYVQISSDYQRHAKLYKEKVIPKATLEIMENKLSQAKSNIKQAEANLELAKINLSYTQIKSPLNGTIGKVLISKGNYVTPASHLARVVQTDPIRIGFSLSDKERMEFLQNLQNDAQTIRFEISYPNGELKQVAVENIFMGNEINPDTATVPVYIDYKNDDQLLLPGNYVDVLVSVGAEEKALMVPLTALAQDINGTYVLTVNPDHVAEQKYLKLGRVVEDMQEVLSGLNENDLVIVQGIQKVQTGGKVKPIMVQK